MYTGPTSKRGLALLFAGALAPIVATSAAGQTTEPSMEKPVIRPAVDGIFEAFETHPLVGLGDVHGLSQGFRFYEDVILDARFAQDVGNVVVEFGGAARQDVIDRYVNGEDVPYEELRAVWSDTVGWVPFVRSAYFAHFFYQVRQVNLALPADERIRVWLGEPPIDWAAIETNEEWRPILRMRDLHAARVIEENILAQGEKALVIYGAGHFEPLDAQERALILEWAETDPELALATRSLQIQIEARHPGAFFVAQIHIGFEDEACTAAVEQGLAEWPALAAPVLGTALERDLRACLTPRPAPTPPDRSEFPPAMPPAMIDYIIAHPDDVRLFEGDAILFLAPASDLTQSPTLPDIYLDEEYRREISRRQEIMVGEPLRPDYGRYLPASMAFTQRY